jgi:hypothetical protein
MRIATIAASDFSYIDEISVAVEGDCLVGDTSTWGSGGIDSSPHPIDCADTRLEVQAGVSALGMGWDCGV